MNPLGYYWMLAIGYSSIFAVVIGLVRYRKILATYRIFVLFLVVGFINDNIITPLAIFWVWHANAINGNIYVLIESIMLAFMFYKWGSFGKKVLYVLITFFAVIWILENIVFGSLTQINSIFRLLYALAIVILSIDEINVTMMHEKKKLSKNAKFIICCMFALFYSFKAAFEVFFIVKLGMSENFYNGLFDILVIINLFTNLGYALAALWIPTKQKFTLSF
ncbi:MAG: hypothetical protein ABI581_00720 [Sediminibacterium sp.]